MVDVINESHENPANHHYVVTIDDMTGDAMACTCPHHTYHTADCKHMAASRPPLPISHSAPSL
ncbi:hypothetical protein ACFFQF_23000 [Haladaptatus pallidirubidus]|uniref:SWIM-type domain-containing protein n=2 Tax=Haladaptatus pallidirubidus TaxID=1008152 RepID=A0AAV3UNJ2_9EURY